MSGIAQHPIDASATARALIARLATRNAADQILARIAEKSSDDHYYGAWMGGSRSAGGFPAGGQTTDEHMVDGKWTDERAKIHDQYAASTVKGVPTTKTPTVYMTGGGPASGKTSGLLQNPKAGIPGPKKAAYIDPDSAKTHIPEYKAGVLSGNKGAASYVHEESSYMSKLAVARALGSGHSVVYDSVGDSGIAKLSAKVAEMRAQGASRIVANYATVPIATAIARSDARALATGRFVPHAYIDQAHHDVSRTARAAIDQGVFDHLNLWDTSGAKPSLIAVYDKSGGLTVKNQSAWDAFVALGGE